MTNITSSAVIDRLRYIFTIHGISYFIVSDNGPSPASQEFNTFCKLNGVKHLPIAPYHPSSNGAAERLVQTFKTSLKRIIEGKKVKELNTILQRFLLTYRATPHCQTHASSAELLFNRKLNTRFNFVKPTLTDTIASHVDNFCKFHCYSKNLRQFYPGDKVWIRDYGRVNTKWIEGQVVKKISDVMYNVKLDCNNSIIQRHVDQLRYMPVIDDIYDRNKQHQPESQIATGKERHGENENELEVPKPKANLNSDIQESPIDLTPRETATLQPKNEQLKYTNSPITNDTTASVPNKRPNCIRRPPSHLKDYET